MTFQYKEFTVSGTRPEVEGVSKFIQEARQFLEDAGWTLTEDRTNQPGSASVDTRLVMQSNGEESSYPTFYMIIGSGTNASPGSNRTSFSMATAYDTTAHDVPGSGVATPVTLGTDVILNTQSEDDFYVWMSGDSEGVVFVTRQGTSTYDSVVIGRMNSFWAVELDPYPLIALGGTSSTIIADSVSTRTIYGNPPQSLDTNNQSEALSIAFTNFNSPYNAAGDISAPEGIFLAVPLVFTLDATDIRGVQGTARNAWVSSGSSTTPGMLNEGRLTASGTFGVQVYRSFIESTTRSLIIRES